MASDGGPLFAVSMSNAVQQSLIDLAEQAKALNVGAAFVKSFTRILYRLKTDPNDLGAPSFTLANAKLNIRRAALSPLYIRFAVHQERPIVFVQKVQLLASSL